MRICVVGAGAIGGLLAARLAQAGEDVSVIARGPHLAAIRANGLTLIEEDGSRFSAPVKATQQLTEPGPQDVVILGMKAHQVGDVLDTLPSLLGPETMIVTAQNGIPWWYFHKTGGAHEGQIVESVDPGGRIAASLGNGHIIGTVVYPASEIVEPGVIRLIEGNRFSLSEVDNEKTPRVTALSECLTNAGFKAPVVTDIRAEIWTKLWGNMSFNPISALTHATLAGICRFPLTRQLAADMMAEARSVGEALGIRFRIPIEKRIAGAEAVGEHKTSMLQDVEAGRFLEVDALIGSVVELGRITGIATPTVAAVYACTKLLAETLAASKGRLRIEA